MVGIEPTSDGLARARELGVQTTDKGVDGLAPQPSATRSRSRSTRPRRQAHRRNAPLLRAGRHRRRSTSRRRRSAPTCVPPVNLRRAPRRAEREPGDLRRPGDDPDGRARSTACSRSSTPRSWPRSRRASAGPGTRQNIDEFTADDRARARGDVGGAKRGKAIIVLNPAEPPILMRDTVYALVDASRTRRRSASRSTRWSRTVSAYVPGYRLRAEPLFDGDKRHRVRRGRGRRATTCRRTPATWTS